VVGKLAKDCHGILVCQAQPEVAQLKLFT
jgi:hypothetical protein